MAQGVQEVSPTPWAAGRWVRRPYRIEAGYIWGVAGERLFLTRRSWRAFTGDYDGN